MLRHTVFVFTIPLPKAAEPPTFPDYFSQAEPPTLTDNSNSTMSLRYCITSFLLLCAVLLCGCRGKGRVYAEEKHELPVIHITTDGEIPWEERCPCTIGYVADGDSLNLPARIKCRGGLSSKYPKHSFALKFDQKVALCGLPDNKSWVLNASYIDKTFMRHKLCYDLFRMMGDYNAAPQCAYARVCENGHNLGLYVVMQRLNRRSLQIDKQDSSALIFKEPKVFYPDSLLPARNARTHNYHGQTYPEVDKAGYEGKVMDDFRHFLCNASDQEFNDKIWQWVDRRNVIDWHLLILFTNGGDGVCKNFYLYRRGEGEPFRVALWDCDHSFGRDGDNELNMLTRSANHLKNIMLKRLWANEEYRRALKERYEQLRRTGVFTEDNIRKMVEQNDVLIRSAIEDNARIWGYHSEFYFDDNDYEQEKNLILQFVPLSLGRMDSLLYIH